MKLEETLVEVSKKEFLVVVVVLTLMPSLQDEEVLFFVEQPPVCLRPTIHRTRRNGNYYSVGDKLMVLVYMLPLAFLVGQL